MNKVEKKIAILGGGNIGVSIAKGLLQSGSVPAGNIMVTRRRAHLLGEIAGLGILTGSKNDPRRIRLG